jgi:putative endonuclease
MNTEKTTDQVRDDMGRKGEALAVAYLTKKGYRILDTNWRHGHKEIDIIARLRDEIIVTEVKTRAENYAEEPWEAVTPSKIRNIVEVADVWLRINKVDLETRFDVISILLKKDGSHTLDHFEGAFIPPVN